MKIKFGVDDLQIGMFVSELDRPWLETPFDLEGLLIEEASDIEQIKNISTHVYVDTEKSSHFESNNTNAHLGLLKKQQKEFVDTLILEKNELGIDDLQHKTQKAHNLRDRARIYVEHTFKEIYEAGNVDIDIAREIVSELVESIINDPDTMTWLTHLKNKNEATTIHSLNVCIHSINLGRSIGLSPKELNILGLGAMLHDIGKTSVSNTILNKKSELSSDEFGLYKAHAFLGYKMLSTKPNLAPEVLDMVLDHHERLDGSGYPNHKKADDISQYVRIVSLIDEYDELINGEFGKKGMSPHHALNTLYNMTPGNFDQDLIEAFVKLIGVYPIGSIVELNTGHTGVVIINNKNSRMKPVVGLVLSRKHEHYNKIKLLNLASEVWQRIPGRKLRITKLLEPNARNINVQSVIASVLPSS